jgi:heat shock protein HtpX
MILRIARATPLGPGEEAELLRTVENLCIAAGLPVPMMYLIESPVPNAFATGRDPEHASLVVTRGLLKLLDQRELEGVIAHELSHIGNHDIRLTTTLAALVSIAILPFSMSAVMYTAASEGEIKISSDSVILLLAMLAGTGVFMLAGLHGAWTWWWGPAYLLVVSPVGALLTRTAISRQREFLADADAVLLTRDPEGLALALAKIAAARGHRLRVGEGSVHLYFADPCAEEDSLIHRMFPSHPPVEERIALLARMGSGIAPEDLQGAEEAGVTAAQTASTSIDVEVETGVFEPRDDSRQDDPAGDSLTPLYEQPDGWSRVLQRLPTDAVVTPVGKEGAFIRVLTNDGVTGFVSSLAPLAVVKAWSISSGERRD